MSSSGSGTVINYGSGSDFFTSNCSGSGSSSQKVTVPTVPVPQHCFQWKVQRLHVLAKESLRTTRTTVEDPLHFGTDPDPDPGIRASDK